MFSWNGICVVLYQNPFIFQHTNSCLEIYTVNGSTLESGFEISIGPQGNFSNTFHFAHRAYFAGGFFQFDRHNSATKQNENVRIFNKHVHVIYARPMDGDKTFPWSNDCFVCKRFMVQNYTGPLLNMSV